MLRPNTAPRDVKVFCRVFPDAFFVSDRPPYFDLKGGSQGRPLSAGFHLMQGYFRDDAPLCELVLDEDGRRELESLWRKLDFVTGAPMRQYRDFIFFERAEPPRYMRESTFDFARSEDKDSIARRRSRNCVTPIWPRPARPTRKKMCSKPSRPTSSKSPLGYARSRKTGSRPSRAISRRSRSSPSALAADRFRPQNEATRSPFTNHCAPRTGFLTKTRSGIRSQACSSPRTSPIASTWPSRAPARQPLTCYELASRLSYFLWSSMPDLDLLSHAAAGDLRETSVLIAQTRRMLADSRVRRFATEFAGNWLGFPPLRRTQRRRPRAISELHQRASPGDV